MTCDSKSVSLFSQERLNCFAIPAAINNPKRLQQKWTDSWLISVLRSCSSSSAFRRESGNQTNIITARRTIITLVRKYRIRLDFVTRRRHATTLPSSWPNPSDKSLDSDKNGLRGKQSGSESGVDPIVFGTHRKDQVRRSRKSNKTTKITILV